jgi:hypothetical protein
VNASIDDDLIALLCASSGDMVTSPLITPVQVEGSGEIGLTAPAERGDFGLVKRTVLGLVR